MGSSVSLGREVHVLLKCSWAGGVRWALRGSCPALLTCLGNHSLPHQGPALPPYHKQQF